MKTKRIRRTLSKVITNLNKPETNREYHFCCWFDPSVNIEDEFQEVRKYFDTFEVDCDHKPNKDSATIVGRGAFAERNKIDVEWVRSYFLDHGWKEEEE
jgi:hypothetical protein